MKRTGKRIVSLLLCLMMVLTLVPGAAFASTETATYEKITTLNELTTGQYVMVVSTGYAPGVLDGPWLSAVQPTIVGDQVTDPKGGVWTLTVDGTGVTITDSNGVTIAPKGGNNNGIKSGDYQWTWSFDGDTQTFTFSGVGDDTTILASNTGSDNKFRAYKNATVSGNPDSYPTQFTLYKLAESAGETPEPVPDPEPVVADIADGVYVIWESTNGKAATALAESYSYGYLETVDVTLTGDVLSGYGETEAWTITNVGDGSFTIQDCYGRYVYMSGTYNSFNVSADVPAEGHLWSAVENGDGTYTISNVLKEKTVAYDTGYGSYGAYAEPGDSHLTSLTLTGYVAPAAEPVVADGVYVIWESTNGKAATALAESYSYGYPKTVDVALTEGVLSGYGETEAWTITNVGDGTFTIRDCYGRYVYMSGTYNSFNVSADVPAEGHLWSAVENGDGTYTISNVLKEKTVAYDTGYGSYGAYAEPGDTHLTALTLTEYVVSGGDDPYAGVDAKYSVYERVDAPAAGDVVLVYNPGNGMALTSTKTSYYYAGEALAVTDNYIAADADAIEWTVGVNEGVYTFTQGENHLASVASGSYFNLSMSADDATGWTLAVCNADNHSYYVYSSTLTGSYGNVYLEWYASKTAFSAYCTGESRLTESDFGFVFYKLVREGVDGTEPEPTPDPEPVPDPEPAGKEYTLTGALAAGDVVVMYNANSGMLLSSAASGYKLAGVAAVPSENAITTEDATVEWVVGIDGDGNYTFTQGELVLGMVQSGSFVNLSTNAGDGYTGWTLESSATENVFYLKNTNMPAGNYGPYYLEYYNGYTAYASNSPSDSAYGISFYKYDDGTEPAPGPGTDTGKLTAADQLTSGSYVMVVSTGYAPGVLDGTWLSAVQPIIVGDQVTDPKGGVWTLTVDGTGVTITDSNGVTIAPKGGNNNGIKSGDYQWTWSFDGDTQTFTFSGVGEDTVILASNTGSDNKFRAYKLSTATGSNAANYPSQFTLYRVDPNADVPEAIGPAHGDQVVIYNLSAQGVLAAQNDTNSIENAPAVIVDNMAIPENGGVVFTVEVNGAYYRFYNETYGYLCSNGTGNNAFYTQDASEDADWTLSTGKSGGWFMESRTAKFNGVYSQYLEYYADCYKTYSMYNVTDYDIYEFFFYPVDTNFVSITGGIVNLPQVILDAEAPVLGQDWVVTFTVDAVFGIKDNIVVTVYADPTGDGSESYEIADAATLTGPDGEGKYTITVPADVIAQCGAGIVLDLALEDTKDNAFGSMEAFEIIDEPAIGAVTPAAGAETGEDLRPVISAVITNAGLDAAVTMTVNGGDVEAVYDGTSVTYTPTADLDQGRTSVTVTVTRADGKTTSKSWSFTVGEAQYQLYFGQLHSHTTYSDGSGSLESALEYIANLPDSAKVDFVAFTDHSNYFDTSSSANPEGALYDMSLASADSQALWSAYKGAIAAFNAGQSDVIALGGFEMTWSGGPGHINTFATEGIVSRNNSTLNNKTADAGMKAYYALLSQAEGVNSISQFNHPGSTFGTFTDFAYYDALVDTRIHLVEVGNGEGQIGAGGYYPSYEYYTMALDKGWHVAPTNNQDNHKGKWGNANDARNVILTDDFSEEGIYEAIRNYRVYATEDKNLEIRYTVNDLLLGTIIEEVPEVLNLSVSLYDPDSSDSISKVEVVVNSGRVAYTWDDPAVLATGELTATLSPDYSYYYIRVIQGDGDIAVTAPVWVGETVKLGISSVECATSTPVTDEELTISTTLFNSETEEAVVTSVAYISGGETLYTDTTGYTVAPSGTLGITWNYTPTVAKLTTITVAVVMEQGGVEYTFTMDVELDVQDASKLVYIGIDASHYNEYVNGNYKDSMGNFGQLAAGYNVRTVTLYTSEDLIAACSNEKYVALILTAPSRRSSEAQNSVPLKVYTEEELAAIVAFNANGGTVILAGWSDHYENYPSVSAIANMAAFEHMAATQNAVLEALGSSLRIGDDATYDDDYNGGQAYRLYFNTYGDSFLTEGVEVDPDHPHDRLYTEVFSHYGGASVYTVDGTLPDTVTPIVFGHSGTYSVDVDNDGLGGSSMYKYEVSEGDSRLMIMASEQLEGKGLIIVSGAAFMSNFEVQATIEDSGSEKNYSNYKICENLVQYLNPVTITPIAEVQAQTEVGFKYTIEGVVTSNASGYDKDTAFFDCIYVQDATGGICCFPVAGIYKIGDVVRITGTTEFYQGEMELQVTSIEVIGEGSVEPAEVTAAQINDGSVLGQLITLSGTVVSYELANGLVQTIMVRDSAGNVARVFIDGYITTGRDVQNLSNGCSITVTGLASYDNTFNAPEGPFPRIRVRDRADVVCTAAPVYIPPVVVEPEVELPFEDVARTDPWYDAVKFVWEKGLMNGVSATEFAPDSCVSRAMIVTVLWRLEGEPVVNYLMQYEDVAAESWYTEAVRWASAMGIVEGYGNGAFGPHDLLTRQQLAAILHRYAVYAGVDVSKLADLTAYADGDLVAAWAAEPLAWAVERGLIKVGEDALLDPNGNVSRKEIAELMKAFCEE